MECKCGGSMKDAQSVNKKAGIVFEYQVCKACGRNAYGMLTVHGKLMATGNESQRLFLTMTEEAPAVEPIEQGAWMPAASCRPPGSGLIRVRFTTGGDYIERPSFFADSWDRVAVWQPYDNGPALAKSFNPPPIPPALRVGTETAPEPVRKVRPLPPPIEIVQPGQTLSLF